MKALVVLELAGLIFLSLVFLHRLYILIEHIPQRYIQLAHFFKLSIGLTGKENDPFYDCLLPQDISRT
jgi:hypothetical protein